MFLFIFTVSCAHNSGKTAIEKSRLHTSIGTELLTQKKYPQALNHLLQAVELNPNNTSAYNNLGLTYYVYEKYDKSIEAFQTAIKINPSFTEARNNLGRTYIQIGQYDRAINEFKIALKDLTYTAPEKSWSNLSLAYYRKNNLPKAKEAAMSSLKLKRNSCDSNVLYGKILFTMGHYKVSSKTFDQALEYCPKELNEEPLYFSALSYYKLGEREEASARVSELRKNFPEGTFTNKANKILKVVK